MTRPRFDVALSFAGEQRDYVRAVASFLRSEGVSLFYDEFDRTRLWGKDLIEELDLVYRIGSRLVVMFVSADYARKQWTKHERRSALAAALEHRREYVLPVRFDDTDLPGLQPTTYYLRANRLTPAELGAKIVQKLREGERDYELRGGNLEVWRMIASRYAMSAFSGDSARRMGGRWTPPGVRVIYAASSLCVSILETLVHMDPSSMRANSFVSMKARLTLAKGIRVVRASELPTGWRGYPAPRSLQTIGAEWAAAGETCVLEAPSAVLSSERIYLLNPEHQDFRTLVVMAEEPVADLAPLLGAT